MTLMLVGFLLALIFGVPVIFALGISMMLYFVATGQTDLLVVLPQRIYTGMNGFVLLAIPLFVLTGHLMAAGGLTRRLLDFAGLFVGRFRGGTSLTAIWGSLLFGGISGSAAADAAAIGSVLIPEMNRQGYPTAYSAALISVSSIMAPLMPASIAMIVYGALTGTSIGKLFVAGFVPGVMLAVALSAYAVWRARKYDYPRQPRPADVSLWRTLADAAPVLMLPVIIVGGIRTGAFTPTEAAAVAALCALVLAGLVYRTLTWRNLARAALHTAILTSTIYLLIGLSDISTFVFATEHIPEKVVSGLMAISDNEIFILLAVNVLLLIMGTFLDNIAILILTVPSLTAIGTLLGLDPVYLGVIVVLNTLIGFTHPPVGLCLYIMAGISKKSVEEVSVYVFPLVIVAIIVLMILTFTPSLVLFLPNLLWS